jgi:hypothetical protein
LRSEFPALLVDDGELDDVRDLLAEIGAEFAHLRGGAVPDRVHPPRDLFVTTSRRAPIARDWPPHAGGPGRPVKIAVVTEDSNTARGMLRRMGFDFLVRRPVHPMALRLLMTRALYRGQEKRREPRVAVGYEVSLRSGLRRRTGLLGDLSTGGCRIVTQHAFEPRTGITVQLPPEIAKGKELSLRGRVLRTNPEGEGSQQLSMAIQFDKLDRNTQSRLAEVVQERALGPAVLSESSEELASPTRRDGVQRRGTAPKRPRKGQPTERRQHRRGRYERRVVALLGDARKALLGRDLCVDGMRVDWSPELQVGSRVRLALYGAAREEPLLIQAMVERDDGDEGIALCFERVEDATAARLEELVAGLPAVESLHDGEVGALGSVLSRIVSRWGSS